MWGLYGIKEKVLFTIIGLSLIVPGQVVFGAQLPTEFTRFDGDEISKTSVAKQMLERIELSKKILADLKEGKTAHLTDQQKFVEEQRRLVQQRLQESLSRMDKDYEGYTPRNAYAKFLNNVNATYHDIYWDQFNYMDNKIQLAKTAKESVLAHGGSYQEAVSEFLKQASISRVEMIQVNQELNIKHGFADSAIQKSFDKYGKLPRYDDT